MTGSIYVIIDANAIAEAIGSAGVARLHELVHRYRHVEEELVDYRYFGW